MFDKILKEIVPSNKEEEKAKEIINEFKSKLEKYLPEIIVGGSFGKDTWLKGDFDIDLFVLFEKDDKNISNIVEEALKKEKLNYIRIHGSRDYFKVSYKDFEFEIVPILKIEKPEDAKNVTDLSPYHIYYVKKKLEENPELKNEIRLLKAFMKNINVYGAESYIKGFSGYATELLIIYYKSFLNFIKQASEWKPKVLIDIEKHYKNVNEAIKTLGKDKTKSPIILIDPTFPKRNATASVSTEKFAKLIFYCKLLLNDLKEGKDITKYFFSKKIELKEYIVKAKKYNTKLIILEVLGKGNSIDIKNSKILKTAGFFKKQIENLGFKILDLDINFSKDIENPSYIYIYVYPEKLPDYELRIGPPVWVKESFNRFYEKWKKYEMKISKDGRIIAIIPRKIKNVKDAIEFIINKYKETLKEKVEYIKFKVY